MRFKKTLLLVIPVVMVMLIIPGGKLEAQVAPAAKVSGLPIGIGAGFSGYNLDYGPGRRMEGLVGRVSFGVFRGLGVDFSARTIFMNTPTQLTRMQQTTYLPGVYYETRPVFARLRPFARFGGGWGVIEFPSNNPLYTRDSYVVYAPGGGAEYAISEKVSLRGEYQYEFWKDFHGPRYLNPQGWTAGVTYYVRGRHVRPHPMS
jgi:opacity protein-like surface antigen